MFARQVQNENGRTLFLEYAWDMKWCDPCASDPLSTGELRQLGVFWDDGAGGRTPNVFLTRLHVRYDNAHFPEDLVFQETADRANFQGRYVLRHPFKGKSTCDAGKKYEAALPARFKKAPPLLLTRFQLFFTSSIPVVVKTSPMRR